MLDSHCHLDQYPNPLAVARKAERAGVTTIAVTNLPSHFVIGRAHVEGLRRIRLALGLHPLLAESHEEELPAFERYFPLTSYIGEVGLDFSRDRRETRDQQVRSFRFVLALLAGQPKFVTIHSRGAEAAILELLQEFRVGPVVFHWYSGPIGTARAALSDGHYFSVNPAMLRSKSGQRLMEDLPPDRALTETDGPFVQVSNRAAVPMDVGIVVESLCARWAMDREAAVLQINRNFRTLLGPVVARTP